MAFDYREFLAENKLTKVGKGRETGKAKILSEGIQIREGFDTEMGDLEEGHKCPKCGQDPCVCECDDFDMMEANAQKDAYLKRKEREKRGNWAGSVGAFVEKHGEDLGRVATNRQALVNYIENTMKPELNDEAKSYVDNLINTTKSSFRLLQALYNAQLAGDGLSTNAGSLREGTASDVQDTTLNEAVEQKFKGTPQEKGSRTQVAGRGYKGKKAGEDQDKMAKSEMKGEKLDITIGGVTKTISKQAWARYRKMTDPEEKKAWKQKHGFIKEAKTLKESLGFIDEVEQDMLENRDGGVEQAVRALYNHYGTGSYTDRMVIRVVDEMVEVYMNGEKVDNFELPGFKE